MPTEVIMPQLGESVVEGMINRWLKAVGDPVEEYEALLEVASDKVDTEIPSPASGILLAIQIPEGETVQVGTVLALIGQPGEESGSAPGGGSARPEAAPAAPLPPPASAPTNGHGEVPRLSPVVARIAAEHRVDINQVSGTGRGGRVTKNDILAYVEGGGAAAPAPTAPAPVAPVSLPVSSPVSTPGDHVHKAPPPLGQPGEVVPFSRMRRLIADHMVQSKLHTAPHVTTVFEADLSSIVSHRSKHKADYESRGVNLTFTAYFMAAAAAALRRHPMVNSQYRPEGIFFQREVNIGMAVAIDDGLIVPVIKNVDELSLMGIARQVNDLSLRARDNKLKADEVAGGTFTITNHGVSGSLFATPIINQPQTGILGVGAIQKRVVALENDSIAIRPMIYLTLTFDHRVLDGAGADWFMVEVKDILENWDLNAV